jgi:hypothetical protein
MKLTKKQMRRGIIDKKLWKGVALANRKPRSSDIHKFGSAIEKIAYSSARSTRQLNGLGDGEILDQLQSGELIPDQLFGWSIKTILAGLLVLAVLKLKLKKA